MKKILIIEDQNDVRENIAELLELSGYEILTAENGKIGVQLALNHHPDLILCDVMMPVLDGFGVLRILEKRAETSSIPFIFLTAKSEKEDFRQGMNLGADDYIAKPFTEIELLDAIEMRLKKSEQKGALTNNGLNVLANEKKIREALQELSKNQEVRIFKGKEIVYEEEAFPHRLYFIKSGKIKLLKTNEDGKEYILKILEEGDFFGYLSLLKEEEYNETATALEDSEVVFIPKDDFISLLYGDRDFNMHFIKLLVDDIEKKDNQLLNLAYSSIRKRVAGALIALYQQRGTELKVKREDLANIVGTAKESVIRTLTDFKKDGWIDIKNGIIIILNAGELMKMPN